MRMVSNRHVGGLSMKRFKRVHVHHKAYIEKPIETKPVAEAEEPVVAEAEPVEKPKKTRKRKSKASAENNEETNEDHE